MAAQNGKWSGIALKTIIALLFLLFCVMLFKHISYPLLWNDESETAMFARQIMHYGYPKCHDGKNFMFLPEESTLIGYKPAYDANITITWASYYFTVIGVFLSDQVRDIYLKTALVRLPSAIMGLVGLIIFILSIKDFFPNRRAYSLAVIAFILIECFSVSLLLNMRQARYYSLVIFITACFFNFFIRYFIHKKYSAGRYILFMTIILFFAYQTNVATFVICSLTIGLFEIRYLWAEVYVHLKQRQTAKAIFLQHYKRLLISAAPILITAVLITPFVIFFETFSTIARASASYHYTSRYFFGNLKRIIYVFTTQELLYPVLFIKIIKETFSFLYRRQKSSAKEIKGQSDLQKVSFFMTLFFVCFCCIIARMPFLWTRYFIVLQPIMIMIMLVDIVIILNYMAVNLPRFADVFLKTLFAITLCLIFIFNSKQKINNFKGYVYEMTHQYKGPLDYLIPYILSKYQKTDTLVLATNCEELSYIYYLNCKVTLGFSYKDLKNDLKYQPDVIIFRQSLRFDPAIYIQLMHKAVYQRTTFPVADYFENTTSELDNSMTQHFFKTMLTDDEYAKSTIYTRVR